MPAEDEFAPYKSLIFDTGPLWEFILFQAVHDFRFRKLETDLSHIKSQPQFHRLSSFIGRFAMRTTTPHVVAEVSYWIEKAEKRSLRGEIWRIAYDQFIQMNMDERLIKLLEMPHETVTNFGATDTSVLLLGQSLLPDKPTILTSEISLFGKCHTEGLNAVHLTTVISN
jgi:hypothetical protein